MKTRRSARFKKRSRSFEETKKNLPKVAPVTATVGAAELQRREDEKRKRDFLLEARKAEQHRKEMEEARRAEREQKEKEERAQKEKEERRRKEKERQEELRRQVEELKRQQEEIQAEIRRQEEEMLRSAGAQSASPVGPEETSEDATAFDDQEDAIQEAAALEACQALMDEDDDDEEDLEPSHKSFNRPKERAKQ